jgi:hypothetical protein
MTWQGILAFILVQLFLLPAIALPIALWVTDRINEKKMKEKIQRYTRIMDTIAAERKQSFPWLADYFAEMQEMADNELADRIAQKKHPALKAAEEVRKIASEKRAIIKASKMLEFQLRFYEDLFPWLEEFKEVEPAEAYKYAIGSSDGPEDEYASLRSWLSPEEYQKLPSAKRYQLALERYTHRPNKSSWDIGIEYERFIGYQYEQQGYIVQYQGALQGKQDMGRDLICTKPDEVLVVQCKRWSQDKTVHEKHIFQLFGTMTLERVQHPKLSVSGIFVTSCRLSEIAEECAKYLDIKTRAMVPIGNYPLVKCNVSKRGGNRIYHLPFDQQYDRIVIEPSRGEFYTNTVAEAEDEGFRRAWRWHPDSAD